MAKNPRKHADARSKVLGSFAYKGPTNMWSIKKDTKLVYSTVYKAVNSLKRKGLIKYNKTVKSQKSGKTDIFKLSFRGFLTHLASYPPTFGHTILNQNQKSLFTDYEAWDAYVHRPNDFLEQLKKREPKNLQSFLKEAEKLAGIIERNGKLMSYPPFAECRFLEKHFSVFIYLNFLEIARMYRAYSPLGLDSAKLKALKKERKGQKIRQVIHDVEDEQLKRVFGEEFLQRIAMFPKNNMPNENLRAFAETLKKNREEEIKYLEKATYMFS